MSIESLEKRWNQLWCWWWQSWIQFCMRESRAQIYKNRVDQAKEKTIKLIVIHYHIKETGRELSGNAMMPILNEKSLLHKENLTRPSVGFVFLFYSHVEFAMKILFDVLLVQFSWLQCYSCVAKMTLFFVNWISHHMFLCPRLLINFEVVGIPLVHLKFLWIWVTDWLHSNSQFFFLVVQSLYFPLCFLEMANLAIKYPILLYT